MEIYYIACTNLGNFRICAYQLDSYGKSRTLQQQFGLTKQPLSFLAFYISARQVDLLTRLLLV